MIYPMMLKVDFTSIKNEGKNPKGLFVTWITNWLVKPFTMFLIAGFFFHTLFKNLIPSDLAKDYLAGAILLGAAPCTAMVFVWSHLTKGNPAFTVIQVATNDLIILVLFTPIVAFLFRSRRNHGSIRHSYFIGRPICRYSSCGGSLKRKLCHKKIWPRLLSR
jgi:ACR3 family arsenite transporter